MLGAEVFSKVDVESCGFLVDVCKHVEDLVDVEYVVDVEDVEAVVADVELCRFLVDIDKDVEDVEYVVHGEDAVVNANGVFLCDLIKSVGFVDARLAFCCDCCFFIDLFLFLRCFCRECLSIGHSSDFPRW